MSQFELGVQYPAYDGNEGVLFLTSDESGNIYLWAANADTTSFFLSDDGLSCSLLTRYMLSNDTWIDAYSPDTTVFFQPEDILYSTISDARTVWGYGGYAKDTLLEGYLTKQNPTCDIVTVDDFASGSVGYIYNAFDSIKTTSVLTEILSLLPVLMVVLIGYIGVRKGVDFIRSQLKKA